MTKLPYNTGKVKIGCMYTPPPPTPTPEEIWVQSALIGHRPEYAEIWTAVLCTALVIALCIAAGVYTP